MKQIVRLLSTVVAVALLATLLVAGTASARPKIPITPSPYTNVVSNMTATTLTVSFDYTGGPTPGLAVGTGPNVYGTQVGAAPAKQLGNRHKWIATVQGLTPGTSYYFRISNGPFNAFGSASTWKRDVVVDFYEVKITTDGDSWPAGCGDFYISFFADNLDAGSGQLCLDDGDRWTRFQMGEDFGKFPFSDWKGSSIRVQFWALDFDGQGQPADDGCGGIRMTTCGDLAYGFRDWATDTDGTTEHTLSVTGEGVNASAKARVTVSSHP